MKSLFSVYSTLPKKGAVCIYGAKNEPTSFTSAEKKSLKVKFAEWQSVRIIPSENRLILQCKTSDKKGHELDTALRNAGAEVFEILKKQGIDTVSVIATGKQEALSIAEGIAHKNYRFEVYKKSPSGFKIESIKLPDSEINAEEAERLGNLLESVNFSRDLVNEPANTLTAMELASRIQKAGKDVGFKVEILRKTKIQALKMGGLLAVNRGSTDEPTFSIIEYKPGQAKNSKPIVLVGKGIVYDTGGLSLKPTPNSMDIMKCDMGGAAAVAGAILAAAKSKLPVHIIGLIPSTDNQPGPDAYKPGDVITMFDGTKVEVMNTDAEGRLILADALAYAKKFDPELVIDLATLTGSSLRALGYYAAATMGTAPGNVKKSLLEAGFRSGDRLVEFPLWDDYNEDLKSDIADIKNLGASSLADVIIAGKFLERFTDYPWMHIDLAGPAFLLSPRGYLPRGGTGFGVYLLYEFLNDYLDERR